MIDEKLIKKINKKLLDLHNKMIELEQIEIERQRTGKPYWKIEQAYRSFFLRARVGMAIIQDGIIVRANSPLEKVAGYPPEELIGTPFELHVHPDDLLKVKENYSKRMEGEDAPIIYRVRIKHQNGSDVEIEVRVGIITYNNKPAELAVISKVPK